jgi:hypothetical protein
MTDRPAVTSQDASRDASRDASEGARPEPEVTYVDLLPDELSLARTQLASGLPGLAEGVLRRHIARLDAGGSGAWDEVDAARALLGEALWRQGRPLAAGAVVQAIRAGSLERRRPSVLLIEAEAFAAAGDPDRAAALMERVLGDVGIDEAWRLRGGVPSRLAWPVPVSLRPQRRTPRGQAAATPPPVPSPERTAGAHARLEAARQSYSVGNAYEGDRQLGLALRLDPRIAADGVALMEPTLELGTGPDRLLLYGDLLSAAGRPAEASDAYDRAART